MPTVEEDWDHEERIELKESQEMEKWKSTMLKWEEEETRRTGCKRKQLAQEITLLEEAIQGVDKLDQ